MNAVRREKQGKNKPRTMISLQNVHQRIEQAAASAGRPIDSVQLLAVSKTFPGAALRAAYAAGQRAFAENYVQEACNKMQELQDLRAMLQWHFIGAIQSNKTRLIAQYFDWVHTVDRLATAVRLSEQRPAHLPALNICIQINISHEPQKKGVVPEQLASLAHAVAALPHLRLRGLMALPKAPATLLTLPSHLIQEAQRQPYHEVSHWYEILREQGLALDTLSLGTSSDFEAAIWEGATMVRVGSAIFGEREKRV